MTARRCCSTRRTAASRSCTACRSRGGAPARLFEVKEGNYGSPAEADGAIVATYVASTQPTEIVRVDPAAGTHTLLTDANRAVLDALDLPKPEHFWFTAKNGKRIHNVIYFPPQLDRSRKYPLLVMPHGGPNAMDSDNFSVRWNAHLLTAPGYVLVLTNYTGLHRFRREVRRRHRARRAARARARSPRRRAGSDQALSVHRRRRGSARSAPATAGT